jgi:ArsR family metal-binding transcriptional regulator
MTTNAMTFGPDLLLSAKLSASRHKCAVAPYGIVGYTYTEEMKQCSSSEMVQMAMKLLNFGSDLWTHDD